jgi:imidazole glycerol-phosphate synthase subunit HisH
VKAAIADYGAGNLSSVEKALRYVGLDTRRATTPGDLDGASAIVLPGVGHFQATATLAPWRAAILAHLEAGRPFLGICLGLQWLFEGSAEAPDVPGLGLLRGRCFRLDGDVKVPHVGWNTIEPTRESRLLQGIDRAQAYFTHSFAAPVTAESVAVTTHGVPFASVVECGPAFAVQWHPEKSGEVGLRLLRNFREVMQSC